jgi:hypothetical protein
MDRVGDAGGTDLSPPAPKTVARAAGNQVVTTSRSEPAAVAGPGRPPASLPWWLKAAHATSLLFATLVLVVANRRAWFFQDEWDFFAHRIYQPLALRQFMVPHNEHWSTLPVLVYRLIFDVAGMHSYWPYLGTLFAVHLLLTHLLWRLMLRCRVDPLLATALAALFGVLGSGAGDLTIAFQMSFVGSLTFGVAAVLVTDHRWADRPAWRSDAFVWLLLLGGLMCSGIGITMVAITTLVALWRRGVLAAMRTASVPTAAYLVWFAIWGRHGVMSSSITVSTILAIPAYAWHGLTHALAAASGMERAGPVLLVLLVGYAVVLVDKTAGMSWTRLGSLRQRWGITRGGDTAGAAGPGTAEFAAPAEPAAAAWARAARPVGTEVIAAVSLAAGALFLFLIIGVGRTSLGQSQADSSRYVYLAMGLMLPLIGVALTRLAQQRNARLVVIGLVALLMISNIASLRTEANDVGTQAQLSRQRIMGGAALVRSGVSLPGDVVDPYAAPDMNLSQLTHLVRSSALPTTTPTPQGQIDAAATLLSGLHHTPAYPTDGAGVGVNQADVTIGPPPEAAATKPAGAGRCESITPSGPQPRLVIAVLKPASLVIQPVGSGDATLMLRNATNHSLTRSYPVPAGVTQFLDLGAPGTEATLGVGEPLVVCGLP